jgi:hypothetical protein
MAQGFFTVERWTRTTASDGTTVESWVPIRNYDGTRTLSEAIYSVTEGTDIGLFRIVQTQRTIAVERTPSGKMLVHRYHVLSAAGLDQLVRVYGVEHAADVANETAKTEPAAPAEVPAKTGKRGRPRKS